MRVTPYSSIVLLIAKLGSGSLTPVNIDLRARVEIRDILMRRHGEFDRGAREQQAFGAVLPQQFLFIQTPTTKFKFHRELMKDLMLPSSLQNVVRRPFHVELEANVRVGQCTRDIQ